MNKKEFIKRLIDMGGCGAKPETWARGWDDAISEVLGIAEELDEQETLSQEWIDENKVARINNVRKMTTSDVVTVEKLKNLLVPKQELPVIPQFVADYIEKWEREGLAICEWFSFGNNDVDEDVNKWLYNNTIGENTRREYLLIDAIRYGYEVEEEQLCYAKIKGHELVETETIIEDGRDVSEWNRNVYFVLQKDGQIIVDMKESCLSGAKEVMTMSQWNDLGINETNADFEEVTE